LLATPASLIALLRSVSVRAGSSMRKRRTRKKSPKPRRNFIREWSNSPSISRKSAPDWSGRNMAFNDAAASFSNPRAARRRTACGTGRSEFGETMPDVQPLDSTLRLPPGIVSGMIRSCARSPFSFPHSSSPSTCWRAKNTLLDSGWRFKSGEVTNAAQPGFNDSDWQTRLHSTQLGLGRGATGKGLLSRARLVPARLEPRSAAIRQKIFFCVRGGQPGGRCLFERRTARPASRRVRRLRF